ncbi:Reverse transcriptase (RNA-dependent DNA polymerase) [Pseudovibrio sp. W64]|uniref:reverse transcriptase family protein n=1 Tax=Pseudovibrio sp. W64 TaxID=1735583 RepID=UPI0007AEC262|nr:reverse transcriptase family protein [Pseudovibrio sp. W64]KZK84802.1 Reverse transcriptase (RNA-dependent DNA polymerase) [Pseudovibrio sp. W64]
MRLPHPRTEQLGFLAETPKEVCKLIGASCGEDEQKLIQQYYELGLPPVTSVNAISVMFGYNPSFTWSLLKNSHNFYRVFEIPKGPKKRNISAPKVSLKVIQKWLATHFYNKWERPDYVFGFVRGKSHIGAAQEHIGANWVISVDIEDFFPSIRWTRVYDAITDLGYQDDFSKQALTLLSCYYGSLAQGAPTSPILSNIIMGPLDKKIFELARHNSATYTRYADDIVISGKDGEPNSLLEQVCTLIESDGWKISVQKKKIQKSPNRLKIHGLLVNDKNVRLTKGYRNQIRAYKHILNNNSIDDESKNKLRGHIAYADHVATYSEQLPPPSTPSSKLPV